MIAAGAEEGYVRLRQLAKDNGFRSEHFRKFVYSNASKYRLRLQGDPPEDVLSEDHARQAVEDYLAATAQDSKGEA